MIVKALCKKAKKNLRCHSKKKKSWEENINMIDVCLGALLMFLSLNYFSLNY